MGVYAVRAHIDWKYALSLELTDPGFDFSVLSEFRARVLTDDGAQRILDPVLQCLRDQHLLKTRGTNTLTPRTSWRWYVPSTSWNWYSKHAAPH